MKVMCINGVSKLTSTMLPEMQPLEVYQSPKFSDSYIVVGYERDNKNKLHWIKKRFIPLSTIDEEEVIEQRKNQLQTT